jgi:hypothetical protein
MKVKLACFHLPDRRGLFLSAILSAAMGLCLSGCGTPNVNPATPRANTGYADFYTDSSLDLSWEVKRSNAPDGEMQTVFSEFKPVEGTVLRLAAPPGNYRFQVWFMNLATEGPETVEVHIENGKVTPVHITLSPSGTTSVNRKVYGFRPSAKGYGRGTKIENDESAVYRIAAVAEAGRVYLPKQQMSYFKAEAEQTPK